MDSSVKKKTKTKKVEHSDLFYFQQGNTTLSYTGNTTIFPSLNTAANASTFNVTMESKLNTYKLVNIINELLERIAKLEKSK